jgi:hypothetical protein
MRIHWATMPTHHVAGSGPAVVLYLVALMRRDFVT